MTKPEWHKAVEAAAAAATHAAAPETATAAKTPKAGSKAGPKAEATKVGRRFTKGASGNAAGMKPGTKHRKTILLAAMSGDDRADIVAKIIRQAKRGCRVSQKLIADRIEPVRKARVKFQLRPIATVDDVVAAFSDVAAAIA